MDTDTANRLLATFEEIRTSFKKMVNKMDNVVETFQNCLKQTSDSASQTDDQMIFPSDGDEQEPNKSGLKSGENSEINESNDSQSLITSDDSDSDINTNQNPNPNPSTSANEQSSSQSNATTKSGQKRRREPYSGPKSKTRRCISMDTRIVQFAAETIDVSSNQNNAKMPSKMKRQSKRRKTIDTKTQSANQCDEQNDQNLQIRRNTNPEQHAKNPLFQNMCWYCGKNEKFLVSHYVKQHPELEVPIARPSVGMADQIRIHAGHFEMEQRKITTKCYFCEETKQMTKHHWAEHYLKHTGELMFACNTCTKLFDRKVKKHGDCTGQVINIFDFNSSNGTLTAFMCMDCNHMQFHLSAIEAHLYNEHEYHSIAQGKQYEKVILLPDLTPIPSSAFTKYNFAGQKLRYRCTICAALLTTDIQFIEHFDDQHNVAKQYDCFCGEKLNDMNGQLTGQTVAEHLLRHAEHFYECMNCERIFSSRNDISHHMLHMHRDSPKLIHRHFSRTPLQQAWISENVVQQFKCNICQKRFGGTYGQILEHFTEMHRSMRADASIIISKKVSFLADKRNTAVTRSVGYTYSHYKITSDGI